MGTRDGSACIPTVGYWCVGRRAGARQTPRPIHTHPGGEAGAALEHNCWSWPGWQCPRGTPLGPPSLAAPVRCLSSWAWACASRGPWFPLQGALAAPGIGRCRGQGSPVHKPGHTCARAAPWDLAAAMKQWAGREGVPHEGLVFSVGAAPPPPRLPLPLYLINKALFFFFVNSPGVCGVMICPLRARAHACPIRPAHTHSLEAPGGSRGLLAAAQCAPPQASLPGYRATDTSGTSLGVWGAGGGGLSQRLPFPAR